MTLLRVRGMGENVQVSFGVLILWPREKRPQKKSCSGPRLGDGLWRNFCDLMWIEKEDISTAFQDSQDTKGALRRRRWNNK